MIAAQALLSLGVLLLLVGGMGLLRYKDPYSRLQAAGVGDVGGAALVVLGLAVQAGWGWELGVLGALGALLLFTGPVATHAVAKGAFFRRHRPKGEG